MAEFWSNNDRGYRIRLWVDQISQDKVANTSQVRFQLALLNTTTTFAQYQCSAYIDFEGQRLNWSGSPSMLGWYQTIPLIDQTVTINHDFNGQKTFSFSAQFNGSGGWSPRTLTISGVSFTLTDIPRGSTTSDVSATIGSPVTIKINARQDSYRHAIWVKYGNYNQKITNENVKDSFTWTPPMDLCNELPNYTNGRGDITVVTYDGGREVSSDTKTIYLNVPDYVKPKISGITLSDTNVVAGNLISSSEHFVQMLSNIKVSFDGASGAYGSTIDHYRAEIVGYNQTITSNGGTFGNLTFNGQVTIRATVTDSRGRQSEPFDKTITILEYFAPSLKIDVKRVGETSSTLEILRNAQIAPLTINGVQKNTMKLTFKVSPYGKNDYTTDNGPASGEWIGVSSIVNKSADLAGEYSAKHSWQVLAILEDKFTSTSVNVDVPVERVVLSYDRQGLGVGKIREFGALDVLGDIYANDSQIQQYQLTSNNGGPKGNVGNANNLYEPGQYCLGPSAPGNPNGQWGFLFHYSYNGNNTDGIKEAIQTFWSNDGRLFFRHHRWSKIIDDWEPWKEFARNDNTNLINTGWQYAGYNNSFYKRVGDILTIKYDFVGNGDTITFATIPKEVFTAPQNYMLTIAVWIIDGSDNTHVQIDKGSNSLMALSTKNGWSYAGQLTIML
ncbi:putative minor structural protein [Streptococcus phage TP-J34]|uniref:Putative minor structural protein n=1 Tax=Streptococcus phage TP-J34 TaxID=73422 RepID=L0P527_9CAUD|nr:tail protein [Streptococcus phage TP-J34]CCI71982.1 putative minor structural protein [Streptococcus phage TP-J34]